MTGDAAGLGIVYLDGTLSADLVSLDIEEAAHSLDGAHQEPDQTYLT